MPLKLSPQVEKCPASVLGQVAFAPVLEAVEVGHRHGPGQVDQGGEDVLRVPVPRHHKRRRPEVAALNPEWTATCGQWELLNCADVHVQDPQLLILFRRDKNQVRVCDGKASHLQEKVVSSNSLIKEKVGSNIFLIAYPWIYGVFIVQQANVLHYGSCYVLHLEGDPVCRFFNSAIYEASNQIHLRTAPSSLIWNQCHS